MEDSSILFLRKWKRSRLFCCVNKTGVTLGLLHFKCATLAVNSDFMTVKCLHTQIYDTGCADKVLCRPGCILCETRAREYTSSPSDVPTLNIGMHLMCKDQRNHAQGFAFYYSMPVCQGA